MHERGSSQERVRDSDPEIAYWSWAMSIQLRDQGGREMTVSAWNWAVLHYVLQWAHVLEDEVLEPLRFGGVELDAAQIQKVHTFLSSNVLPAIPPGCRMRYDLTVTDSPDSGTLHRDQPEQNHSLPHDVLVEVIEFLGEAQAPVEVL